MNRVFQHVNGKEIMICGQRPASFVYAQVHKNIQQTTGRALGKGSGSHTSVAHAYQLVARCHSLINDGELLKTVISLNLRIGQSARIDHPHDTMARLGK